MSRSRNTHSKRWNFPLRIAKIYSNQHRRAYGKVLIATLKKEEDADDNELPYDCDKDANKGDIWRWD